MAPTTKWSSLVAASVTAMSTIALLPGAATALAAPGCIQWGFNEAMPNGFTAIDQANGWGMVIEASGTRLEGAPAWSYKTDDPRMRPEGYGTVDGGIDDRGRVNIFVRWDSGVAGPFTGSVGPDGFASGKTNGVDWWTVGPLKCFRTDEFRPYTPGPPMPPDPLH